MDNSKTKPDKFRVRGSFFKQINHAIRWLKYKIPSGTTGDVYCSTRQTYMLGNYKARVTNKNIGPLFINPSLDSDTRFLSQYINHDTK
jgi:hypothetical protein